MSFVVRCAPKQIPFGEKCRFSDERTLRPEVAILNWPFVMQGLHNAWIFESRRMPPIQPQPQTLASARLPGLAEMEMCTCSRLQALKLSMQQEKRWARWLSITSIIASEREAASNLKISWHIAKKSSLRHLCLGYILAAAVTLLSRQLLMKSPEKRNMVLLNPHSLYLGRSRGLCVIFVCVCVSIDQF